MLAMIISCQVATKYDSSLKKVTNTQYWNLYTWAKADCIIDAFDSNGRLNKPKDKAINKIGHYLHKLSPPFAALLEPQSTHSPGAIAKSLGFKDPRCLQSMVICKQPEIGGAVPPHQDSTFLYTDPPSAVGFWVSILSNPLCEKGLTRFSTH